ncbi:hypothetical protein [Brachybacterium sp.]|uniref:hypothetical protein n=1 Tax=Brachybacterium sp. TaxID=1891286 RepID=UPI002ED37DD2
MEEETQPPVIPEPTVVPDEDPGPAVGGWNDTPVSADRIDVSTEPIVVGDPDGDRIEIAQEAFEGQPGAAFHSAAGVAALGAPIDWIADMPSVAPGGIGLFGGDRINASGRVYAGPGDAILHARTTSGQQAWLRTLGHDIEVVVADGVHTASVLMNSQVVSVTGGRIEFAAPDGVWINGTRID